MEGLAVDGLTKGVDAKEAVVIPTASTEGLCITPDGSDVLGYG